MIATASIKIVSYINKYGGTLSYSLLKLVVNLYIIIPVATLPGYTSSSQGQTHTRLPQCNDRPSVQASSAQDEVFDSNSHL